MKIDSNIQNPHEGSENSENQSSRFSEPPSYIPKKKQKTTAIGLSVVTCVLMGIIGFEVIRGGKINQEQPSQSDLYIPSQTAMLTAAEKEKLARQSLIIQQLQEESSDRQYLIANLNEEVQALSYELLHTKVDLFGYQPNPEQQLKIEALRAQIQDAHQYRKELENALQDKQQIIVNLQQDLEKSKNLLEEKNHEILALSQIHEALHTRLAAEKFQTHKYSDELLHSDNKLLELADIQQRFESLDKELEARELALTSMKEEYDQLLNLYTQALSENEKSTHFLQTEIQALQQHHQEQTALINQFYTASEVEGALLENKSQELEKFLREKNEYDQIIISQNQEIENLKTLELSLQENIENERAHSQTLVKELFATLSNLENLEKEHTSHLHLAETLKNAEEKIALLDATVQAEEQAIKRLQEDYQLQIAANEMLNHQYLKNVDELNQLSTLLAEKQMGMENVEQEVALLQGKYQDLQESYFATLETNENALSRTAAQLEMALILQKDKELESQQLQADLESLTAALQEKETYVGRIEQELQLLHEQYQELHTDSLLAVAQHEGLQQELSAQIDSTLTLQKEKEAEAILLQEKLEQLTLSLHEKETNNDQLEQEILQLKDVLASQEMSQKEFTFQMEQTLTRQQEQEQEAKLLQEEFSHLTSVLQEKEQTIQLLQAKNEELQNNYQLIVSKQESLQVELHQQIENSLALQKEKEAHVAALKDDLQSTTQLLEQKELYAFNVEQEVLLLQQKYGELQDHYLATRDQQESLQKELRSQIAQAIALHKEKEQEAFLLQEEFEYLASDLQTKEAHITHLEQEMDLLKTSYQEVLAAQEESKQELAQAIALHKEKEQEAFLLQEEFEYLASDLHTKEAHITHLEQEINLIQETYKEALAAQEESKQELVSVLALQKDKEQEALLLQEEFEYLASNLLTKEAHISHLEQEILQLKENYQEILASQKGSEQELIHALALQKEKEQEAVLLQEEFEYLASALQDKEHFIQNLQQDLNHLKDDYQLAMAAQENHQQDLVKASERQKDKELELNQIQEEFEYLASLLQEKETLIKDAEQDILSLQNQYQDLQASYQLALNAQQDFTTQLQQTIAQHDQKEREVKQLSFLLQDKESYISNVEEEVQLLQDKHRELLSSFHSALASQEDREQEIRALDGELKHVSSILQGKETHISQVEDEVQLLQDKHRELQSNYLLALAIHENAELEKNQQTNILQKEIEHLTSLLQERELKIASMEHNYQNLMSQKESETLSLQEKIEKIEHEFSEKKQELTNLINQLESSHTATIASDES
ncbi:hypothetical protein [Parachlamydia acanthamoebae]|uniref:Uncharacterized protein n=1 Tax=Parachlamydia acanthamoebae TaxID=83552 RepID=A0A0C1ECU2_9BACT|nr:hypothetical protein [Parachlamydia acanthamoebae]KIA77893.1 hypothetical protein DB43_FL00080 [Parachlamydia acanthamoebae]